MNYSKYSPFSMPIGLMGDDCELTPEGYQKILSVDPLHAMHLKIRILARRECPAELPGEFTFKDHKNGCCMGDHDAIDKYADEAAKELGIPLKAETKQALKVRFDATYDDLYYMAKGYWVTDRSNVMMAPFQIMYEHEQLRSKAPGGPDILACVEALQKRNCDGCQRDLGNQLGHMDGCLIPLTIAVGDYFLTALADLDYVDQDDDVLFDRVLSLCTPQ